MKKVYIFLVLIVLGNGAMAQGCLPEGIAFSSQAQVDNFQTSYPGCTGVVGDVLIMGFDITNLNGLNTLTSIGGNLLIADNYYALTSLTGLDNVTSIGGDLTIRDQYYLSSLAGLNNLTNIGGGLFIYENEALASFTGLGNLASIGGELYIESNALLDNLTGMDNLDAGSISGLYIVGNPTLSSCAVQGICDFLATPNGIIQIQGNASGCNNRQEVEAACGTTGMADINKPAFLIYPNPTNGMINIQAGNRGHFFVFNQGGQELLKQNITEPGITTIDVSNLTNGVYVVKVVGEKGVQVGKFIKE